MRAVADTTVVVSGFLWPSPSRQILDLARAGQVEIFTSPVLLARVGDVLSRRKFVRRLALAGVELKDLVQGYAALAWVILPAKISPMIAEDPDDDEVLACALAARAEVVISGDRHLLKLAEYQGIRIVRPADLLLGSSQSRS